METVIWTQTTKGFLPIGPHGNYASHRKIVRVYNLSSGSYYQSEEMDEGVEVEQCVFSLAGG